MQMQVGSFRFDAVTGGAEYTELQRLSQRRWAARERHGQTAALEDLGREAETLDLRGTIWVRTAADLAALETLRREAGLRRHASREATQTGDDRVAPQPLAVFRGGDDDGQSGDYLGQWVVERLSERERDLRLDGTPARIDFELRLLEHVA